MQKYIQPTCTIEHREDSENYDVELQIFAQNIRMALINHPYYTNEQALSTLNFETIFQKTILPIQNFYETYMQNFILTEIKSYFSAVDYSLYYTNFNNLEEMKKQNKFAISITIPINNAVICLHLSSQIKSSNVNYYLQAYDNLNNQHYIYNNQQFLNNTMRTTIFPLLQKIILDLSDVEYRQKCCDIRRINNAW